MSMTNFWNTKERNCSNKNPIASQWTTQSVSETAAADTSSTRSESPCRNGESICNKYIDIINSKPNLTTEDDKSSDIPEKPFDFFDDDEFAFGINLLNNNVACVGENMSKLVQMG